MINTPSISVGLEDQFAIIKFTPLSLCNIARDYNTQEKVKTPNDTLSEKSDDDVSIDPKTNSSFERKEVPKINSYKNQTPEDDLKKKPL